MKYEQQKEKICDTIVSWAFFKFLFNCFSPLFLFCLVEKFYLLLHFEKKILITWNTTKEEEEENNKKHEKRHSQNLKTAIETSNKQNFLCTNH